MRKRGWLILSLLVLVTGLFIYRTYSNQILSISIYKPGANGLEQMTDIQRLGNEKMFQSLERSFRHQKRADPKADALVEAPFYKIEVKKRVGQDSIELWVSELKVGIQQNGKYRKIEGKYTEAIQSIIKTIR
ncbi:MAG: hypothetical protein K0Q73_385 [Paenibacillus sp.]|nr:hypothetical protein [Paenibacillus sp.]